MQKKVSLGDLPCPIHASQHETIVHVCLQPTCNKQPLLCVRCMTQIHKGHKTVALGRFATIIDEFRYDLSSIDQVEQIKLLLKGFKTSSLNKIAELKELVNKCEADVLTHFETIFSSIECLLADEASFKLSPFDLNTDQPFNDISKEIRKQRTQYHTKLKARSGLNAKSKQIKDCLNFGQFQIIQKFQNFNFRIVQESLQIDSAFEELLLQVNRFANPTFNWCTKHPDIEIKDQMIIRTAATTIKDKVRYPVCGLSDFQMDDNTSRVYRWAIKIVQCTERIQLGMCISSIPQKFSYESLPIANLRKIGHGHYLIGSSGIVFSNFDEKENGTMKGLKFETFQQVQFQYNTVNGKLKIKVSANPEVYEMDVERNKGNKYVVCAYLNHLKDAVSFNAIGK